jgi:acetylornithine/N-succinyldiaminopimelate aminotransferase
VTLADVQALEAAHVMATYARMPVLFVHGEGCRLWNEKGEEHLDFLAGVSVVNAGHAREEVTRAVCEQAARLVHVSNLFYTEPAMRLAERLSSRSLGGKVFFCNSGAEANEAAIKLARRAHPGGEVVVVHGAFHGRTYGALSATPQESKQAPFAPLVPGFVTVAPEAEALAAAVSERTAAVLIEPVQGESGVHLMPHALLRAAREACDATGASLIFDEVQCGMGRTGTLWHHEQTGVIPDAMTVAKALANGLPIGALVTGERLADALRAGEHGSTFGGGPVVAAAALATLELIDDEKLLAAVRERGERLVEGLRALPGIGDVRGRGLMVAADVDGSAPALARRALLEQRLVLNATGPGTLRFLPPLVVSDEEIDEALARLGSLLG